MGDHATTRQTLAAWGLVILVVAMFFGVIYAVEVFG